MYAYIVYASEINNNLKRNKKRNGIFTIDSPSQFLPYMIRHKFSNYLQIYFRPSDHVDALPSPRILNTHYPVNSLPQQMTKQKTKIVHFIRNPKDIAVSLYHYLKNQSWVYGEEPPFVTFSEFLPYITGEYGVCKYILHFY